MMVKTKDHDLKTVLANINSNGHLSSDGRKRVIYYSTQNAGKGSMDAEMIKSRRVKKHNRLTFLNKTKANKL